ncbi:hypothetical protein TRVA0_002S02542 [Trichomonascus vanleenenianus]|uniref:uncharacterized protein n=1 Tax=Trichomonascus vanleenenianus TaxID=2268995 RepID=UPI003EC9EA13
MKPSFRGKTRKWPYITKEDVLRVTQKLSPPVSQTNLKLKSPGESSSALATGDEEVDRKVAPNLVLLPVEILQTIIEQLVVGAVSVHVAYGDIFALSAVNRRFNSLLPREKLYETVVLYSKQQAIKFLKCLGKSKNNRNGSLIKTLCVAHPEDDSSVSVLLSYTGFSSSSPKMKSRPWPDVLLDILAILTNLEHLILDEMAPQFKFPASLEHSKVVQEIHARKNELYVSLSPEIGWHGSLHRDTLWAFGGLYKLHLTNMVIQENSLNDKGVEICSNIRNLILSGCIIRCSPETIANAFKNVTHLTIDMFKASSELMITTCFPNLTELLIGTTGKLIETRKPMAQTLLPLSVLPAKYQRLSTATYRTPRSRMTKADTRLEYLINYLSQTVTKIKHLQKFTIVATPVCVAPPHDPHYEPSVNIFTNIGILENIPEVVVVIPRIISFSKGDWGELIGCDMNLTVMNFDGVVFYQKDQASAA